MHVASYHEVMNLTSLGYRTDLISRKFEGDVTAHGAS